MSRRTEVEVGIVFQVEVVQVQVDVEGTCEKMKIEKKNKKKWRDAIWKNFKTEKTKFAYDYLAVDVVLYFIILTI